MSSGYFAVQRAGTGLNNPLPFAVKIANYTIQPVETGTLFVTDGAVSSVIITLPVALAPISGLSGLRFGFRSSSSNSLMINTVGTDFIQFPGANGFHLTTALIGSACWLHCTQAGIWNVETGLLGTWTFS